MTVAEKNQLHAWLQTALSLELATIPPYMVALLSIRLPSNREAAELIRSVMVEEMLHVALVANILVATGGRPRFDETTVATYPLQMTFEGEVFSDRQFSVELRPFSPEAVETFLKIEMPQRPRRRQEFAKDLVVPGLTIGEFYQKITNLLEKLAREDSAALFTGDPSWQVDAGYYWGSGGSSSSVFDLTTAKAALELVVSQGEAAWEVPASAQLKSAKSHYDLGHYYRFRQIECRRRYRPEDDPQGAPTGDPILVDYDAVYNFRPSPSAADYAQHSDVAELNAAFNRHYTKLMMQLEQTFSGAPRLLYTAIMDTMHELTPLAHEMMKRPYPDDALGRSACPTFEWRSLGGEPAADVQPQESERA